MTAALERGREFLRQTLPSSLNECELEEFRRIAAPVAVELTESGVTERTVLIADELGLRLLPPGVPAKSTFLLSAETFGELISGRLSPQRAFFTGGIRISGEKLLALRVASVLEQVFRRPPAVRPGGAAVPPGPSGRDLLSERQRELIAHHFHPIHGAPHWIGLAKERGISPRDIVCFGDLARLGEFDRPRAAASPWTSLVPPDLLRLERGILLGETGGTTGPALRSAWLEREFHRSFVEPLVTELDRRGCPPLRQWLFVGPTGPHIIGRAAAALARATTGADALLVDFDPRWFRKLSPGSFAAGRYTAHLVEQALQVLAVERPDALFITPAVLDALLPSLPTEARGGIRLVHLGGQSVTPERTLAYRGEFGPSTRVINGYGNSLFGCLIERGEPVTYPYPREHHVLRIERAGELGRAVEPGGTGRITCHRFDESMLLLNVVERDEADDAGECFRFPRPVESTAHLAAGGIY